MQNASMPVTAATDEPPAGTASDAAAPGTVGPGCDLEVDARGLRCPLPILRAKKALSQLQSGQTLRVLTTDPHALRDFQAFARQTGNTLLAQHEQTGYVEHLLSRR